jgi:hypothetical protein
MSEIEWATERMEKRPGNEKYPAMLEAIKEESLEKDHNNWGVLARMDNEPSARDLSSRLSRVHVEFEVVSRKEGNSTVVYARLREWVTA